MADLKNYRARIVREGILKSLFLGLVVGCSVLVVCLLLSWFFGFKAGLWLGIALFAVCTAAVTPTVYYLKFRPTAKAVARRVDELGLEERVLTMTELENDSSEMARMQREDTSRALGSVNHMLLKIAVSLSLCVAVAVVGFFGVGMTTVDALYVAGVIPSGMELVSQLRPVDTFEVSYTVQSGTDGVIYLWDEDWEGVQLTPEDVFSVEKGGETPAVYAQDGPQYIFVGWSDGKMSRYRQDVGVEKDMQIVALYQLVSDEEVPSDENVLSENSNGDGNSDPNRHIDTSDGQPNMTDPGNADGSGSGEGAGGHNSPNQQIVDGQQYYGDRYNDAHDEGMGRIESTEDMPGDLKDAVSDYYSSIEKGGKGSDDGANP